MAQRNVIFIGLIRAIRHRELNLPNGSGRCRVFAEFAAPLVLLAIARPEDGRRRSISIPRGWLAYPAAR